MNFIRKILLSRFGFSRKADHKAWYEANKEELNRKRRIRYRRNKKRVKGFLRKKREYYAKNKHRFHQNSPEGRMKSKFKRNGYDGI